MRALLVLLVGCGRVDFTPRPADATGIELPPWSAPTPVFDAAGDDNPTLTGDMLELYFGRNGDIYVTKRGSLADPWSTPVRDAQLSTTFNDSIPEVSSDGLTIYFLSNRTADLAREIWMATRASRADAWSGLVLVPDLDSPLGDGSPVVSDDGLFAVIPSLRGGNDDLYTSTRATPTAMWATPSPIVEVNSTSYDSDPFMSADRRTLYFRSDRNGTADLFVATRTSADVPFSPPVPISELNTTAAESDPWVSPDGRHMFFASDRNGVSGLWETTR